MSDHTISFNLSINKTHFDKISKYKNDNNKRFKSNADVFRHIIDTFFEDENEKIKNYIVLHVVFPSIFCAMTWFMSWSTSKLNEILLEKGFYFNELYLTNRVFSVLSFLMLGVLVASIYLLLYKINRVNNR